MPKKKKKRYSRLSPAYLASRHAGALFMFLALGLLGGIAYRSLIQPTLYHAGAEVPVHAVPADAAPAFDWEAREREWAAALRNNPDQDLLSANLRYAVKAAATADERFDGESFGSRLDTLNRREGFAASLFNNQFLARFGPAVSVGRRDVAPNMDFQSLATIIADLDPPPGGAAAWDFSFFRDAPAENAGNWIVARPGPDDRFFAVFFRLYEYLKGRPAESPADAWRAAVDELTGRLEREAGFVGGGGFGPIAKREIIREIAAIPVLAANGLYHAGGWPMAGSGAARDRHGALWADAWERDSALALRHGDGGEGVLSVSVDTALNPLAFRRDTVYTRIPPLAAATLLAYVAACEEAEPQAPAETAPVPVSTPAPVPAPARESAPDFVDELEPLESPGIEVTYREVVDEEAAGERLARIAALEESVFAARVNRDASVRRLDAARDAENRLSREAIAARSRADRLQERYDAAILAVEQDNVPKVPPDTARLFARRDEALARLATLLRYCTEEHPFVRQVRGELEVLETHLSGHSPDAEANRLAEERAARVANRDLEWETAVDQADSLEERARRQGEESALLLGEATEWERCIPLRERELAHIRATPVPLIREAMAVEQPAPAVSMRPPPPAPVPAPAPAPAPRPVVRKARLEVDPAPARIPLDAFPPDWRALWIGLLCGLGVGLWWMILREVLADSFRNESEALRMTRLPVLASLPAYDPRSFRAAAATMKGEATRARADAWQFIPAQVETSEPPAEARRGKIQPAARRPRFLGWVFGLLFLLLAGLLYYRAMTGFAQPLPPPSGGLSLPAAAVHAVTGEKWGDLP
ncbi:MAG: hypothetical protein LBS30_01510 [Planctomycetota bacterium]|jgi:hypothetical protein|nr:hypothetical protein [Planctomycetota bacterium]